VSTEDISRTETLVVLYVAVTALNGVVAVLYLVEDRLALGIVWLCVTAMSMFTARLYWLSRSRLKAASQDHGESGC
jgi:hypothetical protein